MYDNGPHQEVDSDQNIASTYDIYHGWVLGISWIGFGFIMIGTNRWFFRYWKYNQLIHSVTGIIIFILTLIYGIKEIDGIDQMEIGIE